MNLDAGRIALALITGFIAGLLAITLSLTRNGRVDVGYVILLVAVGVAGSLIWSTFINRKRPRE